MKYIVKILKCFSYFVNRIISNSKLWYAYKGYEKIYLNRTKSTKVSVSNKREGEDEFIKKWKRISKFVSPIDYRLYSQYIGNDSNIVPEYVMRKIIEPIFHPVEYRQFYNDKNMYDKLLPKAFLATSIIRCIEGVFCDGDYLPIEKCDDNLMFELCKKYDKVIVKPTHDTGNGNSILLYERHNDRYAAIGHNEPFSIQFFTNYYNGNFVIQECMRQSSFTSLFNSSSVNTFRIFTYKSVKTNEVHVLGITFRMGKRNSFVDNCHAGGAFVGVSHDGHFLNPCVFDFDGKRFTSFNGIDFSKDKFVVPNIQGIIDFSKSVGESIYHNRMLDLDVMLDENNKPKLIEFNVDACSTWLYQFSTGTVFGEFTDEVIEYVKSKL